MTPKWFSNRKGSSEMESAQQPVEPLEEAPQDDWMSDFEGQLALDAYETNDELVIKAPVAGVDKNSIDIQITDNQVTIRGNREDSHQLDADGFYLQECYWGSFSRTVELPFVVESKKAKAALKNGLLTVRIPKSETAKAHRLEIESDE